MKKIPRSICIRLGCHAISHFKRLCKEHYDQDYPKQPVSEYRISWTQVETFEGTVRATSRKEALRLAEKGMIAGLRTNLDQGPTDVVLLEEREC